MANRRHSRSAPARRRLREEAARSAKWYDHVIGFATRPIVLKLIEKTAQAEHVRWDLAVLALLLGVGNDRQIASTAYSR
jgi:hypothetical protein